MNPTWVNIAPDGASVEFGGGFHHFGYLLEPADSPTGSNPNTTWILSFYSETSQTRELGRFSLTPDNVLMKEQFVEQTMLELDRRIAAGNGCRITSDDDASIQRCKFAIKHNQVGRLQDAIRETARRNDVAWRDVLLVFVIDFPADSTGATERLRQWAASKADFSAWLMAAYAFNIVGELDAAEAAVLQACKFPADDPPWAGWNVRARGYSMCRQLYAAGKTKTCATLCDSVLAYQGSGDYMANSYLALRNACRIAQSQPTAIHVPVVETGTVSDFAPLGNIDISSLRGTLHR